MSSFLRSMLRGGIRSLVPALLAFQIHGADYLPLAAGNSWVLRSPNSSSNFTLSVLSARQVGSTTKAVIDVDNPWYHHRMLVKSTTGNGIELEGIELSMVRYRFADPGTLFPTPQNQGQTFSTAATSVTVLAMNKTVNTPAGVFTGVVDYRVTFNDGSVQQWSLAPNVGFIQFGTGTGAFVLSSYSAKPYSGQANALLTTRSCPMVGTDANPAANGDFSAKGKDAAQSFAYTNGARFMHISTGWAALEPQPGVFNFQEITDGVARAKTYNITAAVTIKTIDTAGTSMPTDLAGKAWNDPLVLSRFRALLSALIPLLGSTTKYLNLGNEVDVWLNTKSDSLGPFLQFYQEGATLAHSLRTDLSTGVVFAGDSYRINDFVYRVISPYMQHIAFTYYATRSAVSATSPAMHRDPAEVPFDLAEFAAAAQSKSLILTELGYSSSSVIGSSPAMQDQFYANVFSFLRNSGGLIKAANFFIMNDIPLASALVAGQQYSTAAAFTTWFGTLGMKDLYGVEKPAWSTFRTNATDFTLSNSCY